MSRLKHTQRVKAIRAVCALVQAELALFTLHVVANVIDLDADLVDLLFDCRRLRFFLKVFNVVLKQVE